MSSQLLDQQKTNNSNKENLILSTSNQQTNNNQNSQTEQPPPQNSILNKSQQFPSKDIRLNKLNMNSSLNVPSANTATNISLNEQILHQKKDQSDYFDNEVSYQDDDENDPIFKEYTLINDRRNKAIDDLKNITERIKNNNIKIEELKNNLIELKEEKKRKQIDIVNLLSNKESLEEIYKNQIYSLNSNHGGNINNNYNDNNTTLNNDVNNLINISIKNDINDNSMIHLNSNHNITILDNESLNTDEDNFKIAFNELKESDQKKYIEQVITMFEDIFKKKDEKLNSLISNIINNSYELFINNISEENNGENNNELVVTNFFGKVSLFISNHSLGKYSESKINLFLRYLLKINYLNVKLTQYIKFVNKKYKEKKKELNDMINFLEKKNINLGEKNNSIENNMKEYNDRLEFFGKNDVFEIEHKSDNSDEGLYDNDKDKKKNQKRKVVKNRNKNNNPKKDEKEEQLSHDVVIEYEDGIDQNVEINYEEDDLANEYDYEKENEMISQGLNPYSNDNNQYNNNKNLVTNKQNNKKNNNQIIVKDNDESDKYLNEFLNNKDNKKSKKDKNNTKIENLDYLIIEDDDNKDFIEINNANILEGKKDIYKNRRKRMNNQDNNDKISKNTTDNKNSKNKNGEGFQLAKKINYNNNNYKSSNIANNVVSDNRICPTPHPKSNINNIDLENELSAKELEHYNRVQRIMNSGPKVSNIFGVNNYNPENNTIHGINIENSMLFSPKKNTSNLPNSTNKIDKTIRIGSRQNHNFISIINMTKNVPAKKKNNKDKTKAKEKTKRKENEDNNDVIQIINLEENFLNEINDEEKNENDNKKGKESTSDQSNNNNIRRRNNSKENIEKEDNSKLNSNRTNKNNNKNEVQGYYLNIINSKQPNTEKDNGKEKNISKINNKENSKEDDNIINKNEKNELNNTNSNNTKKTMKVIKSRELNINDVKSNKIGVITKKHISKTQVSNNNQKIKTKLIYLKSSENKEVFPLNNSLTRPKTNNSLNKSINYKKSTNNNIIGNIDTNNKSYININDSSKRSHSISENIQVKKVEVKDKLLKNNATTVIVNTFNDNNSNLSPIIIKSRKISNIPISKNKNQNYSSNTYKGNYKKDNNFEQPYVNNKRK